MLQRWRFQLYFHRKTRNLVENEQKFKSQRSSTLLLLCLNFNLISNGVSQLPQLWVLNVWTSEIKLLVRTERTGGGNSSISFHCYLLLKCLYFPPAESLEGKIQTDLMSSGFWPELISHLNSVCQKSFHLKVHLALKFVFWLIINFSNKNQTTTSSFLKLWFW